MAQVLTQPRWAFWKYQEAYRFEVQREAKHVKHKILSFYRSRPTRGLSLSANSIRFQRGTLFGSFFSPIERHHRQEVVVEWQTSGAVTEVTCTYDCFDPYPNLHAGPRALKHEVEELEKAIAGG
jgi:hypothetical protein